MENFKNQLKVAYDADAQRRKDNENNRDSWKLRCREYFTTLLTENNFKSVLELGAGVGLDSSYFKEQGFTVLATDLSEEMVASCRQRGLNAEVIDLYELDSLGKQFDGIYSMNVLLHTPRKDLNKVLEQISNTLNQNGFFFFGVYGGFDEEKVIVDNNKMGLPRFFSFLSDDYIQTVVKNWFNIVKFESIDTGSDQPNFHFQALFLQKRN